MALTTIPFVWLDPCLDMPAWLFAGIGRIAAEWSYLEWELEETIRVLHDTDVKRARIAVTGMNVRSRVMCIANLLQAQDLHSMSSQFAKLGKTLTDEREPERNKVAHGLFSKLNNEWFVIRTSGVRTVHNIGRVSRSTLPERELITRDALRETRSRIRLARREIASFRKQIVGALPPSQHNSPRQLSQHYRRLAQTRKAP
jgi:hypothetical protein